MAEAPSIEDEILRALRRMTRAIDLHSRSLAQTIGLTGPQLVCLRSIAGQAPCTASAVAQAVALSQATITGIVDRLVSRGLVTRVPDDQDRRRVRLEATRAGLDLLTDAPSPLQDRFVAELRQLTPDDQQRILETLRRVVGMMGETDLDAAPLLTPGVELDPGDHPDGSAGSTAPKSTET